MWFLPQIQREGGRRLYPGITCSGKLTAIMLYTPIMKKGGPYHDERD